MKKFLLIILTIGLIIRVLLSFTTYHSDIIPFDFAGKVISQGNITNFYDYLWSLPDDDRILTVYPRNLFNYPPLPYFILGGASLLTTWIVDPLIHENFIFNFSLTLETSGLNLLLFLLKLPYFIFDISIAFLLMKLFKTEKEKKLVFALWIFNPVNLYATYMIGQFDIIPTFLTVLALFIATKKQSLILSAVLLGLGAGFKIFPILFLIPLAFVKKTLTDKLKMMFAGGISYIFFSFPFILSEGFRRTALLASQTTKSFYAQISISGGESVILFLAVVVFIYIKFFYHKIHIESLWQYFFIMILVFLIFTHFHPQWLLWAMPFFVIDLVYSKLKHWPLFIALIIVYSGMISFFDTGLSIGLFAPINSSLYNLSGFWQLVGFNFDVNFVKSILHSIFVGIGSYYIYYYFPKRNEI